MNYWLPRESLSKVAYERKIIWVKGLLSSIKCQYFWSQREFNLSHDCCSRDKKTGKPLRCDTERDSGFVIYSSSNNFDFQFLVILNNFPHSKIINTKNFLLYQCQLIFGICQYTVFTRIMSFNKLCITKTTLKWPFPGMTLLSDFYQNWLLR